jgi:guanylate kinase
MSLLIVTCGPAGVGKTTQMQRLIERDRRRFGAVMSVTTRQRRSAEDGEWYRFVSRETADAFNPSDVISKITYHDEHYVLLKSEIDKALAAVPIALVALVPATILRLRSLDIPHAVICCKIGDDEGYESRLRRRGFEGDALAAAKAEALTVAYPPADPTWPQKDVLLGSDAEDDDRFMAAVKDLAGNLFPHSLL